MTAAEFDARLARVERRARRDRAFALGALALFLATAQAPAAPAGSPLVVGTPGGASAGISAAGLSVRDASGRQRVSAVIDADGTPGFAEFDRSGTLREWAFLYEGRLPVLRQFDEQGHRRDEMHVATGKEEAGFEIFDAANVVRLSFYRDDAGNPEVALFGSDGKSRAYIATDDTAPFLVMKDRSAQTRVAMGAYTSGSIGMDLRDASGRTVWKKP